jgi:hypothetical protein
MKLLEFQRYYNGYRAHAGLERPPAGIDGGRTWRPRQPPFVPLAVALSRAVSHANRSMSVRAWGKWLERARRS